MLERQVHSFLSPVLLVIPSLMRSMWVHTRHMVNATFWRAYQRSYSGRIRTHISALLPGAEGPLMIHLSPYGTAVAYGLVSSRLPGLARFGMLFTPSSVKTATEQVVTDEMIARTCERRPRSRLLSRWL